MKRHEALRIAMRIPDSLTAQQWKEREEKIRALCAPKFDPETQLCSGQTLYGYHNDHPSMMVYIRFPAEQPRITVLAVEPSEKLSVQQTVWDWLNEEV